jgi:hypothetical protein
MSERIDGKEGNYNQSQVDAKFGPGAYDKQVREALKQGVNPPAFIDAYYNHHQGTPEWVKANAPKRAAVIMNEAKTRLLGPLAWFRPSPELRECGARITDSEKQGCKKAQAESENFRLQLERVIPDAILADKAAKRQRYVETGSDEDFQAYISGIISEKEVRSGFNEVSQAIREAETRFFHVEVKPLVLPILDRFHHARHAQAEKMEHRDRIEAEALGIPYAPSQTTQNLRASADRLLGVKEVIERGGNYGSVYSILRESGIDPEQF